MFFYAVIWSLKLILRKIQLQFARLISASQYPPVNAIIGLVLRQTIKKRTRKIQQKNVVKVKPCFESPFICSVMRTMEDTCAAVKSLIYHYYAQNETVYKIYTLLSLVVAQIIVLNTLQTRAGFRLLRFECLLKLKWA